MNTKPKTLLFVCTGNICRSPMAEYIFNDRVKDGSGWVARSAGVFAMTGAPASEPGIRAMAEWGIDLGPHRSQPVTQELVDAASLIVVMTASHRQELMRLFPGVEARICLLTDFSAGAKGKDILDPIGGSVDVYRTVRDRQNSAISDLILYLIERGGLTPPECEKEPGPMKIAVGADHGGLDIKESLKSVLEANGREIVDVGTFNGDSVDYPDFANDVARKVSSGEADEGLLVCTTGVGMSIAANKFPGVRAALCTTVHLAEMSRRHNNANVLAIGATNHTSEEAARILETWLTTDFEGGRHARRVGKFRNFDAADEDPVAVRDVDPEVYDALRKENARQHQNIELIASENYTSAAVRAAQGGLMTNKYAEGYPKKRWYHGCENVDIVEQLAIDRAKELFGAEHANVQPHSGSGANMAVYFAVLEPGDTMLAMSLAEGGHLTHGHPMNFSGRFFNVVPYGVDKETEQIDYDAVEKLAGEHQPKLICVGASAYSRIIDFERFRKIADEVGAKVMVDMAHIAGLVAGGAHPNPVPHAEFVTTTTHKTLRGPRGGLILCREEFAADIARQVFPGIQGGPLMHVIAGKAICFKEALDPSFKEYAAQVVKNAAALADSLTERGIRVVSGGTDNHCFLIDLFNTIGVTGKDAATVLDHACITVNKNAIPFDTKSPFVTSGIRLGSPAVTTRGMKEEEMRQVAGFIHDALTNKDDESAIAKVRESVLALTSGFPVP